MTQNLTPMKRFIPILLASFAITSTGATHRLATYNIRFNSDSDTEGKDWGLRGPICRDVILNYDFDVVGFQEVTGSGRSYRNPLTGRTQLDDLRAWLTDYELVAWDRDGTARREYVATAYKKSKYEAIAQGSFFISPTPDKFSYGWDTAIESHPRVIGWIRLKVKSTGEEFIYATTHTNDGWSLDGPYGSQLISSRIKELAGDLPVMVVADYNSARNAAHAQKGLKAYNATFHDAAVDVPADKNYSLPVTNRQCTWTYNAYHPVSDVTYSGSEIDFQFYRGMNILERHIVTEEFSYNGMNYPSSDHFPIYVDAELSPTHAKSIFVDCNAGAGGNGSITAPFCTISEATAIADLDDTIYVAEGTYRESVQPNHTVTIIGGYTNGFSNTDGMSIIDGNGLKHPPVYVPGQISLTIRNFNIIGYKSSCTSLDGAVHFRGADLKMENVVLEDNSAQEYGGALAIYDTSNPKYCASNNITLSNCIFRGNSAIYGGAAAVGVYSLLHVDGCTFDYNTATKSGGAMYVTFGSPEASRIWFTEAEALIVNSSFTNNNSACSGALYINDEMPNVTITTVNTTFAGNTINAKGGLPNVLKTYGGTGLHAKLANRPSDSKLTKVSDSKINLGHVTITGNHATCTSPANFLASALTVDGGTMKIVNSIVAANTTNGTNAKADVTVDAERLIKETLNIFTAPSTISFAPDTKSHTASNADEGIKAIEAMMAGKIDDNKFIPDILRVDSYPTPFVPLISTKFGGEDMATLSVLMRNLEKEFSVDIDLDGSIGSQLKTDQLRLDRSSKSMPGAVEFRETYSAIDDIEAGHTVNKPEMLVMRNGIVRISADRPLGQVKTVDLSGRLIASANTENTDLTLDLSSVNDGLYIIMCLGHSFKVMK